MMLMFAYVVLTQKPERILCWRKILSTTFPCGVANAVYQLMTPDYHPEQLLLANEYICFTFSGEISASMSAITDVLHTLTARQV